VPPVSLELLLLNARVRCRESAKSMEDNLLGREQKRQQSNHVFIQYWRGFASFFIHIGGGVNTRMCHVKDNLRRSAKRGL
jgi:hypothetical protein